MRFTHSWIQIAFLLLALFVAPCFALDDSAELTVASGFKVELIYTVPHDQGSWISLAIDPQGRFITSDHSGLLYRLTLQPGQAAPKVEPIRVFVNDAAGIPTGNPIGSAQGLLWAFHSLYVVVNGQSGLGSGVYRLRDTHANGTFDDVRLLMPLPSSGEHGPHGLALAPDGKSLYIVAGNDSGLPEWKFCDVPRVWGGDQLLAPAKQSWDWHSKNGAVPGGWICRMDPDGKNWEVVCAGFRNSYRLAFNPDGELFTTDNDNEWHMGLPWYRAPRFCHVTGGGDFGWRSFSEKLPACFPDNLAPLADLSRGGPSGILAGTGAKFPAKYQRAVFALEWAYGKIYAAHLKPAGSSYTATVEVFLSGKPLAVCDALIGNDGAMYFVTGGREIESKLYRVSYVGTDSTAPAPSEPDTAAAEARKLRHTLEDLQGRKEPLAVYVAWPQLDNPDTCIRAAARAVIEIQDPPLWQQMAFDEKRPQAILTAALALARCANKSLQPKLLQRLNDCHWPKLTDAQRIELLRVYALTFIRMGMPNPQSAADIAARLNTFYPAHSRFVDRELSRLLAYLQSPEAIEKTLALLEANPAQEDQVHFALMLGEFKDGWSAPQRQRYFLWFNRTANFQGGRELWDTLAELRNKALASAPESERAALAATLNPVKLEPPPPERPLVKEWTVAMLQPVLKNGLRARNFDRGRSVYHAASCIKCHYFNGEGNDIGPDLTSVAWRFNLKAILESCIDPSKVISDQYAASILKMKDGRKLSGRIRCETNGKYQFAPDPLKPDDYEEIEKSEVKSIQKSPKSTMPDGLLNSCSEEEILDLLAFLVSGGDRNDKVLKSK